MGIMNTYHGYDDLVYHVHQNISAYYTWERILHRKTWYYSSSIWKQPFWKVWGIFHAAVLSCISWWLVMLRISSRTWWPFVCLLWKTAFRSSAHLLIRFCLLLLSYTQSLYFMDINPLSHMIYKYLFSFYRLPFHSVDGFLCCAETF